MTVFEIKVLVPNRKSSNSLVFSCQSKEVGLGPRNEDGLVRRRTHKQKELQCLNVQRG